MSTIYERLNRRKKLCELGNQFTLSFYNFITDFLTDEFYFDEAKFKEKVLYIHTNDNLLNYIDKHYNKQTLKLMEKILKFNPTNTV